MHPANSVIAFTTLSGIGFGLLFWLGLGFPSSDGFWFNFIFFGIAYALSVGGLLASTFHLGHPERAIKAFTQWKTSWLSREAWAAVAALGVMGIFALFLVFFGTRLTPIGWLGSILSLVVVFTTSMIYAQLKTVPRWNMWLTSVKFLALSIAGGALLAGQTRYALWLLVIAGIVQLLYWNTGDRALKSSGSDLKTATGLGSIGEVRAFEPPHTGSNYLMREMIHVIGRKHSNKLRAISLVLMVILPIILLALPFNHVFGVLAVLSHIAGVFVSRWLFFAEAEHVVGLYYGKR